jgi:mono/diheme cytochrome c family protein
LDAYKMMTNSARRARLGHTARWAVVCWALLALSASAQPRNEPAPGDYRIEAGRVDRGTFTGWRLFHSACYGCHGVGGVGTDLAPNLVERVKTMTPRAFVTKVLTSYRLTPPSSDESNDRSTDDRDAARQALIDEAMRRERGATAQILMPAWETDPKVVPHVLDLFAYLSARADGKLGPGKPALRGR